MNKTKIEWTDYTWNPITGCTKGCSYCYARKLANGRLKDNMLINMIVAKAHERSIKSAIEDPFTPRFWPNRLNDVNVKTPRKIFVCNMGDMFGDEIPDSWQQLIFTAIKANPQHTFQLLTKQPQNLPKWSPYPDNCWVGVSATNEIQYLRAIEQLRLIEAKTKFISFEPLLESIPVTNGLLAVDWVIIGAQTKPDKAVPIEWIQDITNACDRAKVPVFLKNNLKRASLHPDGKYRQEFPNEEAIVYAREPKKVFILPKIAN